MQELDDTGYNADMQWDIRLAIDECIINAQKHGNRYIYDKPIQVSYLITPEKANT